MTPRPRPAKVELCATCKVEGVWRSDDEGNVTGKCPTCFPKGATGSPEAERDAALQATTDANPGALTAALAIIRDTALAKDVFSSNDCRSLMKIARVPGPVVGAAFRQAAANGWIRRGGSVPSTDGPTHGHDVKLWESRIFRAGAEGRTA